jgi:hypothetical protein
MTGCGEAAAVAADERASPWIAVRDGLNLRTAGGQGINHHRHFSGVAEVLRVHNFAIKRI